MIDGFIAGRIFVAAEDSYLSRFFVKFIEISAAGVATAVSGYVLALASLRLLKSVGVRRAHLTVDPVNTAAISLYEQVGFGLRVLKKDYLGPGEDRIIMTAYL